MSDISGASDLQNDMPALGPQTGNVRGPPMQLPSALQGLAKFFHQTQPQAPQAPPSPKIPPKPPLTEAQAHQPPQHTGKPASFAPVPPIVPTPSGGFTPYIPTPNKREIDQWTDAVRFPRLPATFEVPGLLNRAGQYFAQAGGPVGDYASQLSGHSQAYIDAFMNAQEWKMKMAKEGQALASSQLEDAISNRLVDYKNTIAEYRNAGGPNKLVGGVDMYHALWENAIKDGDQPAQRMFENGESLEHIINYLHDADKNLRDLQATRQKASDQEAEDATAYGLGPKAEADPAWQTTPEAAPAPTPSPKVAAAPRDQTQPPAPKDATPPPDQPTETADTPDWAKGLDPKLVDAAEQHFRGDIRAGENKYVGRAADRYARQMDVEVNKVLDDAHAGRIKPSEVMDKIRKVVGPRIAADAQNVADYSQPGFGSGMGSGGSQRAGDYARLLDDIAKAADPPDVEHGHPGFVANNYALQDEFKKNNQIRTALIRTQDLPAMADEVKQDVAILRAKGYSMTSLNWQGVKDHFVGGNADFQKLYSDMIAYSTSYQTIIGGGRATLGGTRDVEASFPAQSPLSTYFSVMKGHMGGVRGILRGYHLDWEGRGGKPDNMPRGDRVVEKKIDDYWRMDPVTGTLPGEVYHFKSGDFIWTGKNQIDRKAKENWEPAD